jgi:hypothetical protein
MTSTPDTFLARISEQNPSSVDRAVALLWWHTKHDSINGGLNIRQICEEIETAGYGQQNVSRLKEGLKKDRRTVGGENSFKLNVRAMTDLDQLYFPVLKSKPIRHSDAIFEVEAFKKSQRGYIDKVALQINRSYEESLFDCCAVMVRRLLETLIIEIYEGKGKAAEIKNNEGNFKMFSGLLEHLKSDKSLHLGRTTMQGMENFKRLADSSAHNRRFNASKKHIDDLKHDIQLSVAELFEVAFGKDGT